MQDTFGKVTQVIKDHTAVALLQWAKKLQAMMEERVRRVKQLENKLAMLKNIQTQVDETTVLVNSNQVKLNVIIRNIRSGLYNTWQPRSEYKEYINRYWGNSHLCWYNYDAESENEYDYVYMFRQSIYQDTPAITNLMKYFGGYNN